MKKSSQIMLWSSLILGSLASSTFVHADTPTSTNESQPSSEVTQQQASSSATDTLPSVEEKTEKQATNPTSISQTEVSSQTSTSTSSQSETNSQTSSSAKETSPSATEVKAETPTSSPSETKEKEEETSTSSTDTEQVTSKTNSSTDTSKAEKTTVDSTATGSSKLEVGKVFIDVKNDTAYITYNRPANQENTDIKHAVWSDVKGQDDLVWYSAGKALTEIDLSKHKGYGKFHVHTYAFINGRPFGLNAAEFSIDRPKTVVTTTINGDKLEINYNREKDYKHEKVFHAVWSDVKGQDDLKWYEAGASRTEVDLSNHKGYGLFHVHTYAFVNGQPIGLNAGEFTIQRPKTVVTTSIKGDKLEINYNREKDYKHEKVFHAVWSDVKGQDDLVWYEAGAPRTEAKLSNHKGYGVYHVHTYAFVNGQPIGLSAEDVTLQEPKVAIKADTKQAGTLNITVTNVPSTMFDIEVPVWSDLKGQDDLVWYKAQKTKDGDYDVRILLKNHHFDSGKYNIHVYGKSYVQPELTGLLASSTIVNKEVLPTKTEQPIITVSNIDEKNGRYVVTVEETAFSKDIKSLAIASWSTAEQSNLKWYNVNADSRDKLSTTIDVRNHKDLAGIYNNHVYITYTDGSVQGYIAKQVDFSNLNLPIETKETYLGTGVYQIDVKHVTSSGDVLYAIWSNDNGQDDIRWYQATPSGSNTFTGIVNTQNHKGTGTYNLHIYQRSNGQLHGLLATSFQVARSDFSAPYYSQRDGRWANQVFGLGNMGQTGCVPTTLASVISALKGNKTLPTEVASYLYNQTDTFNKGMAGTTSKGIVLAAKNWGLRSQVMKSEADLRATLEQGHYVLGAVGQSQFVHGFGATHELVLKGFNSGQTYVLDPYRPQNNGWYSVSYLFSHRSFDPGDNTEGLPFIAIKD